jgi:hypothetical protein
MPKLAGRKQVFLQFRAPKIQGEALDRLATATGHTQSELLRLALTWYLGSPQALRLLEFGAVMGRPPPPAVASSLSPPPVPPMPARNAPCPCGSGLKFKRCCAPIWPRLREAT